MFTDEGSNDLEISACGCEGLGSAANSGAEQMPISFDDVLLHLYYFGVAKELHADRNRLPERFSSLCLDLRNIDPRQKSAHNTVHSYAGLIRKKYVTTQKVPTKDLSPYLSASGYLKRASYVLTIHLVQRQCEDAIFGAGTRGGHRLSPAVEENPFHWMLAAIFPNTDLKVSSGDEGVMFPQARNRLARELLYAYQHAVPPQYLVGFLYQSGNTEKTMKRLKQGGREPWLAPEG